MKALLIGGNRFVGVEMAWHLLHAGYELTVLALDSPPADIRPHIRWLKADRNDDTVLGALFAIESFDCVVDNIAYQARQVEQLIAALNGRIGRYVLTSTTDCYPSNMPRSYTEDQAEIREYDLTGLSDAQRYSYGKRSCEAVLQGSGVEWTVLRPCLVTGPRDNRNGSPAPRMIHWFEESARSHFWVPRVLDGGPILLCSGDEVVLKQIWVGDLARAVIHVLARPETVGQAYNVTGDEIWSNERMVHALAAAAGTHPDIVHVPNALLEQAGLDYSPVYGTAAGWTLADNAKLKATGWLPTPAEQWLPQLLEANARPEMRSWYHTRIQEIALARHVQRSRQQRTTLAAPSAISIGNVAPHSTGNEPCSGQLAASACHNFQQRAMQQHSGAVPLESFYAPFGNGVVSRIGIGTWMGDTSAATDQRYIETLIHAASRGINVFDTAINYRHMQAERCVGAAVRRLVALGIHRESLCIASKGGYVTHDASDQRNAETYIRERYLLPGLIDADEMRRLHSLKPRFIVQQIDQSLHNLGLNTIDVYYLHNPEDERLHLDEQLFYSRLTSSFVELEKAVAAGKIGCYGVATWDGFRVGCEDRRYLSLERVISAATEAALQAGVPKHHLGAIQTPFNVKDHRSYSLPTQLLRGRLVPVLEAIADSGLYCFTSASVLQGSAVPEEMRGSMPGISDHTAVLRAAYSTPGVGTALAGMRRIASVEEAMIVSATPLIERLAL